MGALIPAHGDGQGIFLMSMCIIFWTLAFLAVAFRLWARQMKSTRLVVNDYAIIAALFFGTGLVAVVLTGVLIGGLGQHAANLKPTQLEIMAKILVAGSPVWAVANMFIKISILHLYCTIFVNRTFRIASYTIMVLAICLALAIVLQSFLICRPFAFNWDPTIPGGHCGNNFEGFKAQTIVNIAIDSAIVLLPVPLLWGLQMSTSKKLGIYFMFSLGIVICVITGLRYHESLVLNPLDITYTAADYALLNMLETTLGIINTCLPVCRPSLKRVYPAGAISLATRLIYSRGSRDTLRWQGSDSTPEESNSKNAFHRINDVDQLYPLTNMTGTQTQNTIIGGTSAGKSVDLEQRPHGIENMNNPGNITVSQKWEVDRKSLTSRSDSA